jgi:hypothetical protein
LNLPQETLESAEKAAESAAAKRAPDMTPSAPVSERDGTSEPIRPAEVVFEVRDVGVTYDGHPAVRAP